MTRRKMKDDYRRLIVIANEIEDIRKSLYTNEFHKNFNPNWKSLDDLLFEIQSKILHDSEVYDLLVEMQEEE